MVFGRSSQRPSSSTLENSGTAPLTATVCPSSPTSRSHPAIQSNTSFETLVLLQTTMKTGGVEPELCAFAIARHCSKDCS
jgi:hypothetical protein